VKLNILFPLLGLLGTHVIGFKEPLQELLASPL